MRSTSGTGQARGTPEGRRSEIAVAARGIALEQGLDAVTQRAVAQRAGITPALVAHYVSSMDALVADTFAAIVGEELREVRGLAAAEAGPVARLAAVLGTLLDGSRQEVTLVWVQAWALGRRNEPLAAAVRHRMDDWRAAIREVLDEGDRSGAFSCEDVDGTAWHVLAMVDGLNAHALVRWGAPVVQARLLRRAVEAMLGLHPGALHPRGAAAP
jgi:AcrR family transcriptional regulator